MDNIELVKTAKTLIRGIDSRGRMSMGNYDRNTPLMYSMINDWALFQDNKLIGYIKNKEITWLE